jgi:uncharacterized membrane protein YccC
MQCVPAGDHGKAPERIEQNRRRAHTCLSPPPFHRPRRSLSHLPEEVKREITLASLEPLLDRPSIDERWTLLENQRRLHGLLLVSRAWLVSTPCPDGLVLPTCSPR